MIQPNTVTEPEAPVSGASDAYEAFLRQKRIVVRPSGFDVDPSALNPLLFDWQKDIVRLSLRRGRSAMFADCGLGKTAMQLEWAHHVARHTDGALLILTPLAVSSQTMGESDKFHIPNVRIVSDQSQVQNGINITNYEKLHHFDASAFSGVVLDESSILKSYDGKTRTQIIESFRDTRYKLECSATPAPNDFMELGNHSEFLNVMRRMEMLATFFIHDGSNTSEWRLKGHARSLFWEWVASWAVFIRSPSDIGYSDDGFVLPGLSIQTSILEGFEDEWELFAIEALDLATQRAARKESMPRRVAEAASLANANNEQWLVWCDFNAESDLLTRSIRGAVEVKGSDSEEHKSSAMLGFARGEVRVLVSKPTIAGFGMNFQSCRNMIFCGLSHSYEQFYQAIRRCYRFGQTRAVNVTVIIGERERAILENVLRKEKEAAVLAGNVINIMQDTMFRDIKDAKSGGVTFYMAETITGKNWTMIHGDCVEEVRDIPDESVGLSVFSPPFASLYTYSDSDRDMGNNADYDGFERNFRFLVKELFRITMPGRNVCVHCMNLPLSKQSFGEISIRDFRGDIIRWFAAEGFLFHSEVCIWKDPVVAMQRTKALGLLWKQVRKDSTMSRQGIPDYLVTFRKPGVNPRPVTHTMEEFPVEQWQRWASPVWTDIDQTKTLNYMAAREDDDERHICPLQLQVIERAVVLWSNPGDTVFTPFAGIGSEVWQSVKLGRVGVGIELKRSYFDTAVGFLQRLDAEQNQMALFDIEGTKEETA